MKKGPDADVPPAGVSTGQQQPSIDPFGDIAETWKGAMAPWLAWFGAAESAARSQATKLGAAAAQVLTRPEKMLESMSSLSGGFENWPDFRSLPTCRTCATKAFPLSNLHWN
jgi:hypothetical protein